MMISTAQESTQKSNPGQGNTMAVQLLLLQLLFLPLLLLTTPQKGGSRQGNTMLLKDDCYCCCCCCAYKDTALRGHGGTSDSHPTFSTFSTRLAYVASSKSHS